MGATITTRVPDDIERKIERISRIEHLDKSTVVRRLLSKAVQDWQIDNALDQYRDGKITLGSIFLCILKKADLLISTGTAK